MVGEGRIRFTIQFCYLTPQASKNLGSEKGSSPIATIHYYFGQVGPHADFAFYHFTVFSSNIIIIGNTWGSTDKVSFFNYFIQLLNLLSVNSGIPQEQLATIVFTRIMTGRNHYTGRDVQMAGREVEHGGNNQP
jgi:hypothetical protein